ncbi:MBL fold metallo-hydrolase [Fontibacillus sp. BL9]|uniref:MBL fold metallo-hydrolase n=1 Tax=Fontibacillus sp. BL9 TaxID=3389971 RepID=UPI00397DBBA9
MKAKRRFPMWIMLIVLVLWLAGCKGEVNGNGNQEADDAVAENSVQQKEAVGTTGQQPQEEKEAIELDTDTLKNDSGKTMIKLLTTSTETARHDSYAIVSSKGTVIVADPNLVPSSKGLIKADVVTVSHTHPDHSDPQFLAPYLKQEIKGSRVSRYQEETFTVNDVKVTGIPASHSSEFDPANPSDMIYLFEVDGLRIAHFGDMAQTELTEGQLKALGKIDVSISVFSDAGGYGFSKDKTVRALEQLKPAIVMPGHYEPETADYILEKLKIEDNTESDMLLVSREDIDSQSAWRYVLLK